MRDETQNNWLVFSFWKPAQSQLWPKPTWWLLVRRQASADQWASLSPRESTCAPGLQPAAAGQLLRFLRQHRRRTIHGGLRFLRSGVCGEKIPWRYRQRCGVQRRRTQRQPDLRESCSSEWLFVFHAVGKMTLPDIHIIAPSADILLLSMNVVKGSCIFILRIRRTEFSISTRPLTNLTIMTFSQRCLTRVPFIEKVTWISYKGNSLTRRSVRLQILCSFSVDSHSFSEVLEYCTNNWILLIWILILLQKKKWIDDLCVCVSIYVINTKYCNAFSETADREQLAQLQILHKAQQRQIEDLERKLEDSRRNMRFVEHQFAIVKGMCVSCCCLLFK